MRRELTGSFARGARFGLLVVASTLALSLLAVFLVVSPAPTPTVADTVEMDARHQVASAVPENPPRIEMSDALLDARPPRAGSTELSELVAEFARRELEHMVELIEEQAEASAEVAGATAAPAPRHRVVTIPDDELYARLAAAFPGDADRAYRVVMCESSGNAGANTGNGYYGMWQFDLPTWQAVGGSGLPSEASIDEQIMRARMLYDLRGWGPWPNCGR